MEAALRRRNYALTRMADVGFISRGRGRRGADASRSCSRRARRRRPRVAPYFLEEVRKELEARYGAKQLYENGLTVQTALDLKLQDAANRALDEGLRRIDKRHGFRKPRRNVVDEGHAIETFKHPRWDRPMRVGDIVPAVVADVDAAAIHAPRRRAAASSIDKKGFALDAQDRAVQLVTPRRPRSRRGC